MVWYSKKHATVALSIAEAEYVSVSTTVTKAIWLRGFFSDLGFPDPTSLIIYCDNKLAIAIANSNSQPDKQKHIDLLHHFIKDEVEQGFDLPSVCFHH